MTILADPSPINPSDPGARVSAIIMVSMIGEGLRCMSVPLETVWLNRVNVQVVREGFRENTLLCTGAVRQALLLMFRALD